MNIYYKMSLNADIYAPQNTPSPLIIKILRERFTKYSLRIAKVVLFKYSDALSFTYLYIRLPNTFSPSYLPNSTLLQGQLKFHLPLSRTHHIRASRFSSQI